MQDRLGHLNDVDVASRLAHELSGPLPDRRPAKAAAIGGGQRVGWYAHQVTSLEPETVAAWEGVQEAGARVGRRASEARSPVLVANRKGGCGKTTIATNLAAAFAARGLRTALADVDRQRSGLDWLALRPARRPRSGWPRLAQEPSAPAAGRGAAAGHRRPGGPADKRGRGPDRAGRYRLVPVLPSVFDEGSTRRFVDRLEKLKPVRKGRKPPGPGRQPAPRALPCHAAAGGLPGRAGTAGGRPPRRPHALCRPRHPGAGPVRPRGPPRGQPARTGVRCWRLWKRLRETMDRSRTPSSGTTIKWSDAHKEHDLRARRQPAGGPRRRSRS